MIRTVRNGFRAIRLLVLLALFTSGLLATTTAPAFASGFSLSVSPSSATTQPGSAAVFFISVKCNACNVVVGASISPVVTDGPTLHLSSYHVINGGSPALRVDAGPSTPLMTYTITVVARDSSGATKSATATLAMNDFTIAANPTSVTVAAGQTATSTVTATAVNGFSETIYYAVNEPSVTTNGLACNLQPDPVTFSSTVTVIKSTLSCSGTPGTYNVAISASPYSGLPVRSTSVTITVR